MVYVSDADSWQRIFQVMKENSRWDLPDPDVGSYLEATYDYVVDFLIRREESLPYTLDPAGDHSLRSAKQVRREALRRYGPEGLRSAADDRFGLPAASGLSFSHGLEKPLYPLTLSERS
jgi:hypothetical protein